MYELTSEQVKQVSGGLISAETVGCALGGALGASLGGMGWGVRLHAGRSRCQ